MEILFATDGSPGARTALDVLRDLPLGAADRVTVLGVAGHDALVTGAVALGEISPQDRASALRTASATADALLAAGIAARARTADAPVPQAIVAAAAEIAADLIVVGSRGRGVVSGTVLGSVARAVVDHAPTSVLVVRGRRRSPERLLVAIDGSDRGGAAVALLQRLPLRAHAAATIIPVAWADGSPPHLVANSRLAERALGHLQPERAAALPGRLGAQAVLERATSIGADLIVLGVRAPRSELIHVGVGLVQRVLAGARCAVLVACPPLATRSAAERTLAEPRTDVAAALA